MCFFILQELSNQLTSHPTSFQDRLPLVHTVNMQSSWIVKVSIELMADIMQSTGYRGAV